MHNRDLATSEMRHPGFECGKRQCRHPSGNLNLSVALSLGNVFYRYTCTSLAETLTSVSDLEVFQIFYSAVSARVLCSDSGVNEKKVLQPFGFSNN